MTAPLLFGKLIAGRHWALFALTALALAAFTPLELAIEAKAGCSFVMPDMMMPWQAKAYGETLACLNSAGGAGRDAYLTWHSSGLDLLFPALLATALTVLLKRLLAGLPAALRYSSRTLWTAASILPVSYAFADYAENLNVARWLKSGDSRFIDLIQVLTLLKFAALGTIAMIAAALIMAALRHRETS